MKILPSIGGFPGTVLNMGLSSVIQKERTPIPAKNLILPGCVMWESGLQAGCGSCKCAWKNMQNTVIGEPRKKITGKIRIS